MDRVVKLQHIAPGMSPIRTMAAWMIPPRCLLDPGPYTLAPRLFRYFLLPISYFLPLPVTILIASATLLPWCVFGFDP